MKKLSLIMAVVMAMALCMTGCGEKTNVDVQGPGEDALIDIAPEGEDAPMAGGWTLSESIDENVTEEEAEIFDKALEELVGVGYRPIALIGTQVVAGTNYAFLCTATPVTPDAQTKLAVVIVYRDLEGNAVVDSIKDFDLAEYTHEDKTLSAEQLAGGWTVNAEVPVKELEENAQEAFAKATGELMGKTYEAIELLGTQVVAGTNYAVLAKTTLVTAEPVTAISVVTVYADLEGNASVISVADISIADILA